jgi:hypothetical protein
MSPGTVGEEAERLFEALQQASAAWSRGRAADGREAGAPGSDRPRGSEGSGHQPETCGICPVCQAIARLGQARPEVVAHLADATTALVAAFSALAAEQPGTRTRPGGYEDAPRPTTEHIDVTD